MDWATEIVPDWRRRILEGEARKFANAGNQPRTLWVRGRTYWDEIYRSFERIVWERAYFKRLARMERTA